MEIVYNSMCDECGIVTRYLDILPDECGSLLCQIGGCILVMQRMGFVYVV